MAGDEWRAAFDAWIDEKFKVNGRSGTVTEATIIKVLGEGYEAGYSVLADHAASLRQQLDAEREQRRVMIDALWTVRNGLVANRMLEIAESHDEAKAHRERLVQFVDDALAAPAERRGAPRPCRHCDWGQRRFSNGETCVICEGTGCSEHTMTVDPSCSTCRIA